MIDYISMNIKISHPPLPAGRVISVDHLGDIKWEAPQSMEFLGSYESKLFIRSQKGSHDLAEEIFIKGNPSKFLQGHNLFGSDCLFSMLRHILDTAPLLKTLSISDEALRNYSRLPTT